MAVKEHRHCSFVAILTLKLKAPSWQEPSVVAL